MNEFVYAPEFKASDYSSNILLLQINLLSTLVFFFIFLRYSPVRNDYQPSDRSYRTIYNTTSNSGTRKYENIIYVPNGGVGPAPVIKLKRIDNPRPTGPTSNTNNQWNNGKTWGKGYGKGHKSTGNGNPTHGNGNNYPNGNNNWNPGGGRQDDYWFTTPSPTRFFTVTARTNTPTTPSRTRPTMSSQTVTTQKLPKTTGLNLPKSTGYDWPFINNNNNHVNVNIVPGPTDNPNTADPRPTQLPLHTTPKMFDELIGANDGKEGDGTLHGGNTGEPSGPVDDFCKQARPNPTMVTRIISGSNNVVAIQKNITKFG